MKKILLTSTILLFICSNQVLAQINHNSTIHEPLGYTPHFDLKLLERVVTQKQNIFNQRMEYIQEMIDDINERNSRNANFESKKEIYHLIHDFVDKLNDKRDKVDINDNNQFLRIKKFLEQFNNIH